MKLLLAGFEPFAASPVNPSQQVVEAIASSGVDGIDLHAVVLPVVGGIAPRRLIAAMRRVQPEMIVCLGESTAAEAITFERVAVNLRDYRIADNAGRTIRNRPVVRGGPDAYFATLPLASMYAAVEGVGVRAAFSLSAGAFLCNEVMYAVLHECASANGTARTRVPRAGFIHLPQLPEQRHARRASRAMTLHTTVLAVTAALGSVNGRR